MKPRLIIFDKDGTLIDNILLFMPTITKMIKNLETHVKNKKKFFKFLGYNEEKKYLSPGSFVLSQPLEVTIQKISKHLEIEPEIVRKSIPKLKINKETVIPYIDLKDLFQTLKREDIKIAMNTSDRRDNTEKCIKVLGIKKYLDMVVCGDDGIKTKPSPDTIKYICDEMGISPYETFMVGDTQADIDAGLRAKCGGVFLVREDGNFNKFKNYHVHIKDVNQLNYYL